MEVLLPILQETPNSPTHLLTYAAPVTRTMMPFNDLKYYALPDMDDNWKPPKWLTMELGILAGRVYFKFSEYDDICQYFGVSGTEDQEEEQTTEQNSLSENNSMFSNKPLSFLQQWLSLRRKGQDFTHTPMGYVCQSKILTSAHPFFSSANNAARGKGRDIQYRPSIEEDDAAEYDSDIDNIYDIDGDE